MMNANKNFNNLIWLGVISTSIALAIYAYLGIFTRYMADDYCLLTVLQSDNVINASLQKYLTSSNRFSNLFIIGLWEIFPNNTAFVPALHIILWLLGLYWITYELNCLFNLKLKSLLLFLVVELLVLFTFYTTPNLFQVLYWRPGQVTYFTPLVLFTFLMAWLFYITNSSKNISLIKYVLIFALLAFFVGGLSETINALHVAVLFVLIGIVYLQPQFPKRNITLALLVALFVGTLTALLAMFFSPANALRMNAEDATPSMMHVILRSLNYTYAFLLGSFESLPIPFIALIIIFTFMSYLLFVQIESRTKISSFFWIFLVIPILAYGLIFITFAPSAYGQSYPVERVRFPAHYILNIGLIILSVSLGYILSFINLPRFTKYFFFLLACFTLLYPFWMARLPLQTYEERRLWSKRWDEREIMIYNAIHNGETELVIPGLDGYEGTKELDALPNYWANKCAASYYGVSSIATFSIKGNVLDYFSE